MDEASIMGFIKVLTSLIGGGVFLVALAMLKGAIAQGVAYAMTEFLLKSADETTIDRVCRWWTDGRNIKTEMIKIRKATEKSA